MALTLPASSMRRTPLPRPFGTMHCFWSIHDKVAWQVLWPHPRASLGPSGRSLDVHGGSWEHHGVPKWVPGRPWQSLGRAWLRSLSVAGGSRGALHPLKAPREVARPLYPALCEKVFGCKWSRQGCPPHGEMGALLVGPLQYIRYNYSRGPIGPQACWTLSSRSLSLRSIDSLCYKL